MSDDRLSFLPDPTLTLADVLALRRTREPYAIACTEVIARGRELEDVPITILEVDALARRCSVALADAGVGIGDRVVVSTEAPATFLGWFLGAQRLGAIPVPLPGLASLDAPASFSDRVRSVASDCHPSAVVVEDDRSAAALLGTGVRGAAILVADSAGALPSPSDPRLIEFVDDVPLPQDVAFLQYTSGSTGSPKGVVVTHENLVANFRAIASGAGFGPDERSLSWLPLYHDMGLIGGFLLGLYMGTAVFVMRPRAFVFRPDSWLRAMSKHRATFTVAPNFAYSLVGRKLPESALRGVDLSSLRLAFNGAEPIDRATVDAFLGKLAPFGLRASAMYPVYGLAECTLAVAFPEPGTGATFERIDREKLYARGQAELCDDDTRALSVISVGQSVPGHRIRIVDVAGGADLPDGHTGEIVVSGPSVSPGYFGREDEDREGVHTGDLGYLRNGNLYVVDRIKDLVIIRGRNFSPSDLERTVAEVEGVTRGSIVSFGLPSDDGTEALVVVAAVDPTSFASSDRIRKDIVRRLAERFSIPGALVHLVAPGSIPKTSSGKVRRRECARAYADGTLPEVGGVVDRARFFATRVSRRLGAMLAESD